MSAAIIAGVATAGLAAYKATAGSGSAKPGASQAPGAAAGGGGGGSIFVGGSIFGNGASNNGSAAGGSGGTASLSSNGDGTQGVAASSAGISVTTWLLIAAVGFGVAVLGILRRRKT